MTEKMTITQGLLELKLLKSRIDKAIDSSGYLAAVHTTSNPKSIDAMSADIKASYASICDLINRRMAIKRAIVLSNATTTVNVMIDGSAIQMTKAEAIDLKSNLVPFLTALLRKIASDGSRAIKSYEEAQREVEKAARQVVTAITGNTNLTAEDVNTNAAYKQYIENNKVEMVDPLDLAELASCMDNFIHDFVANIDTALSISNAVTEIVVEYDTGVAAGIILPNGTSVAAVATEAVGTSDN